MKKVEIYSQLQYKAKREADTALWFVLYNNYDSYKNNEINFHINKLNIDVKNIKALRDNNIDDITISHDKFEVTNARKLAIINSKLFKEIVNMELEKIDYIEKDIDYIDFDSIDSLNDYFNLFVSENF